MKRRTYTLSSARYAQRGCFVDQSHRTAGQRARTDLPLEPSRAYSPTRAILSRLFGSRL